MVKVTVPSGAGAATSATPLPSLATSTTVADVTSVPTGTCSPKVIVGAASRTTATGAAEGTVTTWVARRCPGCSTTADQEPAGSRSTVARPSGPVVAATTGARSAAPVGASSTSAPASGPVPSLTANEATPVPGARSTIVTPTGGVTAARAVPNVVLRAHSSVGTPGRDRTR